MKRKLNSENIRRTNRKLVLQLQQREKVTTRRDLSRMSGLDPSTITNIVREFIKKGYLMERATEDSSNIGRHAVELVLKRDTIISVVITIGASNTNIGIGYFDGSVEIDTVYKNEKNPHVFIKKIEEQSKKLRSNIPDGAFLGYTLSVSGMVDQNNSVILDVPHLGWRDIDLKNYFGNEKIILDNEANLCVLAERFSDATLKNSRNMVYVYVSEGIGCGLVLDGSIYRGPTFSAGEFGHMSISENGKECYCGNTGCWETLASTEAIVKEFEKSGKKLEGSSYGEKFRNLIEISKADKAAIQLIKLEEEYLARGIINIVNIFNPEEVIIGGEGVFLSNSSINNISESVKTRSLHPTRNNVRIRKSKLKIDGKNSANSIGAALLAIDETLFNVI